jgi:uncharacterized protein (TIGR04255 family)
VVFGIQFKPVGTFKTAHLGQYWHGIKDRFPESEDQQPINHKIEPQTLAPLPNLQTIVEFEFPFPRCWFLNDTGLELVQVQKDRFLRNWRQLKGDEIYPRFDHLFTEFKREWGVFRDFLGKKKLGEPKIDQCELSYINHVWVGAQWEPPDLSEIFSFWKYEGEKVFLPNPEAVSLAFHWPMPDSRGRMHAIVNHARRQPDGKFIIVLDLTARGAPDSADLDGITRWFHLAHEWIVQGFTDLTTKSMHERWGRTR